jgi:hypothetical protein
MAHYAFLENNIVTEVIVGIDETELIEGLDPETWYSNLRGQDCKRTSFNSNIRGHFAGVGYSYIAEHDLFMFPKCHEQATLNIKNADWNCTNAAHNTKELFA